MPAPAVEVERSPQRGSDRLRSPLAPAVFALPDGLSVSGVTLWAVRLANALAAAGRAVALILHDEPPGQGRLRLPIDSRIYITRLAGCPPLRDAAGDLSAFIPAYRDAVLRCSPSPDSPVVLSPNLLGDAYGIGAALTRELPGLIRIVGWQHADIAYDARVLEHYEPMIARFAGVSGRITDRLRERLPSRTPDIGHVPYGVEVPEDARDSLAAGSRRAKREAAADRPLRLIYTGRIEQRQKRVLALICLSDILATRDITHTVTLVGDGPASAEVDAVLADPHAGRASRIRRLPPCTPRELCTLLTDSDIFVLASRWEGLSVSMLEAMAHGCVPVVTRVASGAAEAIADGHNGILVEPPAEAAGDRAVATAMADAVMRLRAPGRRAVLSAAARETIRDRYSIDRHLSAATALLDAAAASPPRTWPADRPCAFTAPQAAKGGGSGTVPPDGARRLRALLETLAGRTIIIHGAGRHTTELSDIFLSGPARIAAVADDDPARCGSTLLGVPIVRPCDAAAAGGGAASDVVISSWIHAEEVWERRGIYERQGLRVHRVY